MNHSFINTESNKYAIYYSVYSGTTSINLFTNSWDEMAEEINNKKCFFVLDNENIIGGFTLTDNELRYLFTIPPFCDRTLLWERVLKYALNNCDENEIILGSIPEEDQLILTDVLNAKVINIHRRMLRPTEKISVKSPDNFYFSIPNEKDKEEIIQVVYEAHSSAGYNILRKGTK